MGISDQFERLRTRSLLLLFALILVILSVPLQTEGHTLRVIVGLFYVAVFGVAGALLVTNRSWVHIYFWIAVPYLLIGVFNAAGPDSKTLYLLSSFLGIAVQLLLISAVVTFSLFNPKAQRVDRVIAGVCGYLILGLLWDNLYTTHEAISPGGFQRGDGTFVAREDGGSLVYFSFVTLSTLGYGDITPKGSWPQILAAMQAVTGTLYLTVFISSLVSGFRPSPAKVEEADESEEGGSR